MTDIITTNVFQSELTEFIATNDPRQHCKATFPLLGVHGAKDLATVYFEIEPGDNLGRHTDSAEELLIVLEGNVEVTVGEKQVAASQGALVLVPKMVPHDIRNIGGDQVKVLGVFGGANNIVATFEKEWLPMHENVVDTGKM